MLNHLLSLISRIILTVSVCVLLTSCMTRSSLPKQSFDDYLTSFIGLSRQDVMNRINFQQYGFEITTLSRSTQSEHRLLYSVLRPVMIPLPIQSSASAEKGMSAIPADTGNSYQLKQICNIIFDLDDQKVKGWKVEGKGC